MKKAGISKQDASSDFAKTGGQRKGKTNLFPRFPQLNFF
jgi:hypothetical protein